MKSLSTPLRNAKQKILTNNTGRIVLMAFMLLSVFMVAASASLSQSASAAGLDSEKVDVRARAITVYIPGFGTVTGYHLYLLYTDKAGTQRICQGFPFDPATGQIPPPEVLLTDPPGLLTLGRCGPYLPGNIDYTTDPSVPSVTAATGKAAHKAYECFVEKTGLFNVAGVPYHELTGPNSNTYARSMLDNCGVQAVKPTIAADDRTTPGWLISIDLS